MTTAAALLPLAHAGEGATWQALLTLASLGIAVVVLLAAAGVVSVREPGDLVLPLAGVAVLASLSGATSAVLSDWVGWAFPVGVVATITLLLVALTALDVGPASPLLWGAVVVAGVAALVLQEPLTRAWHPVEELGFESAPVDDLEVTIVAPDDGAEVEAGTVELVLEVSGGTLGRRFLDQPDDPATPDDPEELVVARVFVDGLQARQAGAAVPPAEGCLDGCDRATYPVDLGPGEHTVLVDVMTADGRPFAAGGGDNPTSDRITVTAE